MRENIDIRIADIKDLNEVILLDNEIFSDNKASKNRLKKRIKSELVIVVEIDKEVVGFLFYKKKGKDSWLMGKVAVSKNYRRKGIGSKLFNYAVKKAKKEGVEKFIYRVRTNNKQAIKMYKQRGAYVTEEIKDFYRDGQSAYQMEERI